jgi:hypothetical protein
MGASMDLIAPVSGRVDLRLQANQWRVNRIG